MHRIVHMQEMCKQSATGTIYILDDDIEEPEDVDDERDDVDEFEDEEEFD